ncbi:MAG: sulfotransferase [Bacteroidota bacterium]
MNRIIERMVGRYIPFTVWYDKFFKGRVVFLTGVGRSGTSILGKIIGSSRPVYYIYEPNFIKFTLWREISPLVLFEDFVMPAAQGFHLNMNPNRESWSGHIWQDSEIINRWKTLDRRIDLLPFIMDENPIIVVKLTEWQMMLESMRDIYQDCKFIHIVRNGNDVVASSIIAGWWNDLYMLRNFVDWVDVRDVDDVRYNIPWYIDDDSKDLWYKWNRHTRSACVWRCCMEHADKVSSDPGFYTISYESLVKNTQEEYARLCDTFNFQPTELTRNHLARTMQFKRTQHEDVLPIIEEPERSKFKIAIERYRETYGLLDNGEKECREDDICT